jgi:hypothetical protein
VPVVVFPPVTPFTCQVTLMLLVFCTVAVNCWVPPALTVGKAGEIVTLTGSGAVIVTGAETDLVESACETAVAVTVAGFGTVPGAVY